MTVSMTVEARGYPMCSRKGSRQCRCQFPSPTLRITSDHSCTGAYRRAATAWVVQRNVLGQLVDFAQGGNAGVRAEQEIEQRRARVTGRANVDVSGNVHCVVLRAAGPHRLAAGGGTFNKERTKGDAVVVQHRCRGSLCTAARAAHDGAQALAVRRRRRTSADTRARGQLYGKPIGHVALQIPQGSQTRPVAGEAVRQEFDHGRRS